MFAIVNPVCALLVEHIISCKLDLKSVLTKKKCYRFQSWPPLLYVKSEETQLAFPLGQSHIEIVQKYLQSAMAYSKKKKCFYFCQFHLVEYSTGHRPDFHRPPSYRLALSGDCTLANLLRALYPTPSSFL